MATGRLSFYREDNHWSARGVEDVARVVATALAAEGKVESGRLARRARAATPHQSD